jgi:hypothetical protein
MHPIRHIRRLTVALAGLACAWLALAVAVPPAFAAMSVPPPGSGPPGIAVHPPVQLPVHTIAIGGMPGWQIALIAIGAALFAATAAVVLDRARTARRRSATAGCLSHAR